MYIALWDDFCLNGYLLLLLCVCVCLVQVAEDGYRRLAPGQSVGLRHAGYVISLVRTEKVRVQYCICTLLCIQYSLHECLEKMQTKERSSNPKHIEHVQYK